MFSVDGDMNVSVLRAVGRAPDIELATRGPEAVVRTPGLHAAAVANRRVGSGAFQVIRQPTRETAPRHNPTHRGMQTVASEQCAAKVNPLVNLVESDGFENVAPGPLQVYVLVMLHIGEPRVRPGFGPLLVLPGS